ncbi:transporter substrate-binding domain-containing protein [Rheinheimera baltica]|uniref:substrate-binding periplasmic protein n=1 Tax=Rheinheimera baltica TaxID=67576 RepID=UPI00273E068E|nr:transporter substrate-binding domain-containing protein [Rheinheimera baltica]MDP5142719.1 transporter substrate-binding domain-containing protein [Rheinheimera baltica]
MMRTLILSLYLLLSCCIKAEQPNVQWCLDNYPNRHNYPEQGEPYGPTVDFMQELAKRAEFNLTFSPNTPFARCLKLMQEGKTDLMTSLNYSDERNSFMHLIPYDHARAERLYIHHQHKDIIDMAELSNMTVGIIRGYIYNAELPNLLINHSKNVVEVDTEESAMAMLLYQRLDAVIAPMLTAGNLINNHPRFKDKLKAASLSFPFNKNTYVNIALSRNSPHARLLERIQHEILQMEQQGLIKHYYKNVRQMNQPVLQWCLDHLPPRHIYQPGMTEPTGPMVTMMRELAKHSGFELSFSVPTPAKRCLQQLIEGKTDIVTGVVDTSERQQHLLMAPFDIARTESWFVRKSQQPKGESAIHTVALLKDKPYRSTLTAELAQKNIRLLFVNNAEHALTSLFLEEVDAIIGPEHVISHAIASQPRFKNSLVLLNTPADTRAQSANLAMSRTGTHALLFDTISSELTRMMADGKTRFYTTPAQQ